MNIIVYYKMCEILELTQFTTLVETLKHIATSQFKTLEILYIWPVEWYSRATQIRIKISGAGSVDMSTQIINITF